MAEQSKGFFRVSLAEQLIRRKLAVGFCPLKSHIAFLIFIIKGTVFLHRVFSELRKLVDSALWEVSGVW